MSFEVIRRTPLTPTQAARADAVIAVLARLWPKCFAVFERRRRPLAIGIDKVLLGQLEPAIRVGRISEADIKSAMQRYTSANGYLEHCAIVGNARIGLDGKPCGPVVTEEQARIARTRLAKRRARKAAARKAAGSEVDSVVETRVEAEAADREYQISDLKDNSAALFGAERELC